MEAAQYSNFGATERKDKWWTGPLITVLGLGVFFGYLTFAAFQGDHYEFGPYLSPLYSPLLIFDWWHFSPAFLILWAPGGFRMSCYYYRKAYYRLAFLSPPACAVQGAPRKAKYWGETTFPFVLQNAHRFFLYLALIFNAVLWYDAVKGFCFEDGFGVGVGSLVLTLNAFMLMMYSFSCHCFRHLVGGKVDCFSTAHLGTLKYKIWQKVSIANEYHMAWAWSSLVVVAFTDLYIRLCSKGIWTDIRFF